MEENILNQMQELKDKLNNSKDYDKLDLLQELNNIGKQVLEQPLLQEYSKVVRLYEETYNEYLFASNESVGE